MTNLACVKRYQKRHPKRVARVQARNYKRQKALGWPNRRKWKAGENGAIRLLNSARQTAWVAGRKFSLKRGDIVVPRRCPVLGIPLFFTVGRRTNNTPSIDRINNRKGYTPENIVVVSWRANDLKRDMTYDELQRLARFYARYVS
jgi:hypothetical protein